MALLHWADGASEYSHLAQRRRPKGLQRGKNVRAEGRPGIRLMWALMLVGPLLSGCSEAPAGSDGDGDELDDQGDGDADLDADGDGDGDPWAIGGGGPGDDAAGAVARFADGSLVVAGLMEEGAVFGDFTPEAFGGEDIFVAKVTTDGQWAWATSAGGTSSFEWSGRICVTDDDSVLLTGAFDGSANFGGRDLTSTGAQDVFVSKLDANGNWLWTATAGGEETDAGAGITPLTDGGALVTGRVGPGASFGDAELSDTEGDRFFVARISASGTWMWAQTVESAVRGDDIAAYEDGSAIVVGRFFDQATFGDTTLTSEDGGEQSFIARLGSDGEWDWAVTFVGEPPTALGGISLRPDGSIVLSGTLSGTAYFGDLTVTSSGMSDVLAAALSPGGEWLWVARAGGVYESSGAATASLPDGSTLLSGYFFDAAEFGQHTVSTEFEVDAFVAKLSPSGEWMWAVGALGRSFGGGIVALDDGSPVVAGTTLDAVTFGDQVVPNAGESDVFVWRLPVDP